MWKVLLAALAALVLAGGAWALFLREDDPGRRIDVGALEDGVKLIEPELADQRVALGEEAGFNALNVTSSWKPGQSEPDPGEVTFLRNVAALVAEEVDARLGRKRLQLALEFGDRPRHGN